MFHDLPDLLNVNEARQALRLGRNKILELLAAGEIEGAFKIGRTWRIPKNSMINSIIIL